MRCEPGGEDRARDRRDLAAAEAAQDLERVLQVVPVALERAFHGGDLALHPSSSRPVPRPTQWAASPP